MSAVQGWPAPLRGWAGAYTPPLTVDCCCRTKAMKRHMGPGPRVRTSCAQHRTQRARGVLVFRSTVRPAARSRGDPLRRRAPLTHVDFAQARLSNAKHVNHEVGVQEVHVGVVGEHRHARLRPGKTAAALTVLPLPGTARLRLEGATRSFRRTWTKRYARLAARASGSSSGPHTRQQLRAAGRQPLSAKLLRRTCVACPGCGQQQHPTGTRSRCLGGRRPACAAP
jgi:hypothetical protein